MSEVSLRLADGLRGFTDIDLAARLTDTEDHFTERKTKSDRGGWLRTTVAFANSTPIGYPALLFVGVANDGTITDNGDIEDLMKSYSDSIASNCYPPIYTMPRVFTHNGKSCIAVTIPGSQTRPHFAGKSYIRDGPQTKEASEEQYTLLIAERQSKIREILKWKGHPVWIDQRKRSADGNLRNVATQALLVDCNQFYVTVRFEAVPSHAHVVSFPLRRVDLSNRGEILSIEVSE